ncbi:MAG TPA: GNAT family N-acetyltransferase [Gaiellaceae bacterium]|nr:GNAT family N-acetyltransferase [Gaiellaceae bacterium]
MRSGGAARISSPRASAAGSSSSPRPPARRSRGRPSCRGEIGWLEDLWVEPAWIGRGVGRRLFEHVAQRAREHGARRLEWEAEPNARSFYERLGATYVRESEETEWGRVLEVLGIEL